MKTACDTLHHSAAAGALTESALAVPALVLPGAGSLSEHAKLGEFNDLDDLLLDLDSIQKKGSYVKR